MIKDKNYLWIELKEINQEKYNEMAKLTRLIENIYKIFLTRDQKGTFVYICDGKLREYFKKFVKNLFFQIVVV